MITVSVLVATGLAIAARHPLARMLGTEVDTPPVGIAPATAPPAFAPHAPALALPVPVAPTHAPRDPFRSLVGSSGALLAAAAAPSVATTPSSPPTTSTSTPTLPAAVTSTCAGSMHRVAAGESLWTLAARAVHSNNAARVTVAWHRIYAVNRDVLANPSLIKVGQSLCLPTKL
jgi:nucleoid-associated protein YgaU